MKRFKDFIKTPKEEFIFNSHGSHAHIDDSLKESKNSKEYDDHSAQPTKNYFAKNENSKHLGFDETKHEEGVHDVQMGVLHDHHKPNTTEGVNALRQFTRGSREFTENLLHHHIHGTELEPHNARLHDNLKHHAFQKLNHDLQTYSGVGYDIDNVKPVGKSKSGNKVYHQPTYMSSSIRKPVAYNFAARSASNDNPEHLHVFHWHHEKGQPVSIVGHDSIFGHEHEVLIPPTSHEGHHIELLKTEHRKDMHYSNRTIHIHHVKRIPESEIVKD
jgi:hypothetical protein